MNTPKATAVTILVATDIVGDAVMVKGMLNEEFDHVFTSTDPAQAVADFEQHRPDVLVLAFNELEKSERYYLGLYRLCQTVHQYPHRTVILCGKDEVKRVYELCMKDYFDDYILFWPMTYDSSRLLMSVHNALRDLALLIPGEPSAAEPESAPGQQAAQGEQHVAADGRAVTQAEQNVGASLVGFSQQLISGSQPDSEAVKNADESARALNASDGRIRPTVMVVDDDEFQHKIIGKLLEAENYQLIFASDGFEALNLLRKTWPDVILMDVMMHGMDGMETTRRLKAIPQFAKTPVIMITGNSEGKVVVDSLKAGAVDFVVKPFDRATLIAKIVRALSISTSSPP